MNMLKQTKLKAYKYTVHEIYMLKQTKLKPINSVLETCMLKQTSI